MQSSLVPRVDVAAHGSRLPSLLALLLTCAISTASLGQPYVVNASWRVVEPVSELQVEDGVIELALEDAIAIALQRNLGLRVERFRRAQALFTSEQNLGIYDTLLSSTLSTDDETTPAASSLDGAAIRQREVQVLNLRADQLNPFGGTASIDWSSVRLESNSLFSSINPSYTVDFDVLYSQPLLRNFGRLATNRNLRVARLNSSISLETLETSVSAVIEQVQNAYWTLVEARAQLMVAEESLALAQQLHEQNRVQVEVGTKAPLELVQSEAGIATREEEIIRAAAAVDDAADELRRLLNLDGEQLWSAAIEPSTGAEVEPIDVDLESALETAIEERPEVASQRLRVESLSLDEHFFRNQKLPSVDFQLRYGLNGIGGDVLANFNPFDPTSVPEVIPGGYDDALSQIVDGSFDGWQLALNFAMPLQNRAAKANHTVARLAAEEGRAQLQDLELQVRTDVRQTARGVATAEKQIESVRKSVELAQRNLEAEQKKYENGLATSFEVLQIQEDLTEARSREVTAVTGYRRALVRFYRSIGRLLEESDVELQDVARPDEAAPPKR